MRFLKGDYIHRKGTKSWFLNPPQRVIKADSYGYRCFYDTADISFEMSHSKARQYEVVLRILNGQFVRPKDFS